MWAWPMAEVLGINGREYNPHLILDLKNFMGTLSPVRNNGVCFVNPSVSRRRNHP